MNPPALDLTLPQDRRAKLRSIAPDRNNVKTIHPELQDLFARETEFRRALWHHEVTDDDDYFENVYHCALLLYLVGSPADVPMMWKAKRLNMDVGSGLDYQFLVGAGVNETIAYLDKNHYDDIEAYIRNCDPRNMTPEALEEWEHFRIDYFYGKSSRIQGR
jgi:hypothetical protein